MRVEAVSDWTHGDVPLPAAFPLHVCVFLFTTSGQFNNTPQAYGTLYPLSVSHALALFLSVCLFPLSVFFLLLSKSSSRP